jgi:hypothetical protein
MKVEIQGFRKEEDIPCRYKILNYNNTGDELPTKVLVNYEQYRMGRKLSRFGVVRLRMVTLSMVCHFTTLSITWIKSIN